MNDDAVKGLLKLAVAAVGFKVVYDWLQEEGGYSADDEKGVVDAYYEGRFFDEGPTQAEVANEYEISQGEVSKTINAFRRKVWVNWDWNRAAKNREGEVERVAEITGLRPATVAAIVHFRHGQKQFKIRRRQRKRDDARQGKLSV